MTSSDWIEDCLEWRGKVLDGEFGHWCFDWDDLPIDETCPEWPCTCYCKEHKSLICNCGEPDYE